ncbi:MAG: tRNA (guanine(46)-N(7))-methyltransferase TrmB [Rhizobiaceae bacterium]|nr:tRNA (guanine(46)-N(7))-methyltransferase TrmB [Rhizobiaceae bacterium]
MTEETRRQRSTEAFFGRRHGKSIRSAPASALAEQLPHYRVELKNDAPQDIRALFSAPVSRVWLEIGFGGGEHLLHEARRQPDIGFIGVEPFVNGMAKLMVALAAEPLPNLRIYDDDATQLLDWLPASSIDGIDLLYPDPWPKKRHWKRRFVNETNLDRFVRVMKPGALFHFASDIDTYVNWTLLHCRAHADFEWTARSAADWYTPYEAWPGTRYEAKALRERRRPAYLTFRRR